MRSPSPFNARPPLRIPAPSHACAESQAPEWTHTAAPRLLHPPLLFLFLSPRAGRSCVVAPPRAPRRPGPRRRRSRSRGGGPWRARRRRRPSGNEEKACERGVGCRRIEARARRGRRPAAGRGAGDGSFLFSHLGHHPEIGEVIAQALIIRLPAEAADEDFALSRCGERRCGGAGVREREQEKAGDGCAAPQQRRKKPSASSGRGTQACDTVPNVRRALLNPCPPSPCGAGSRVKGLWTAQAGTRGSACTTQGRTSGAVAAEETHRARRCGRGGG